MTQDPRAKRPPLERTEPLRSWSTLLGGAQPSPDANVRDGVNAGYRVIDEYLRQGQEAARTAWSGLGGVGSGQRDTELTAMTSQMLRYASEMATMWTGMLSQISRQAPLGTPPQPQPLNVAASPQPMAAVPVWLQVASARPVEVCARLEPRAAGGKLRAHDLRATDEHAPRLAGVRIEPMPSGELRIALQIDAALPATLYSGLIVDDATNLPAGTLSVRILSD